MTEVSEAPAPVAKEGNRLTEIISKDKMRAIAAIGLAGAGLLGISGKIESGVGVGVEIPDPFTGKQVSVGVMAYSSEDQWPMGLPKVPGKDYKDLEVYQVKIGGAGLAVYAGSLTKEDGEIVRTIGVYPAGETTLGRK